ncbi:MAG TPA: thioesterase family protein [Blastocatellia bacterium]|nr:thioesterase family protein [Blastocatellia bacterium]
MEELLKDYPVVVTIPVAWGEMDAMRHVNNVVYFRWFESARIAYFDKVGMWEFGETAGIGPILHSINCRYRIPLAYPDTVSVGARVTKVEEDRFVVQCRLVSHRHQKVAAESEGTMVSFNYREQKKALLPEELKQRIRELENNTSLENGNIS